MRKFKLNLITAKDDLYESMQYVKVTKKETVATNAHVLAIIPTSEIFDEEFIKDIPDDGLLIHADDWKKMLQFDTAEWKTKGSVIKLCHSKKRNVLIEVEHEDDLGFKYPNYESVIPQEYGSNVEDLRLNPKYLHDLQQALNADGVQMLFPKKGQGIKVMPVEGVTESEAYGIIMPIRGTI